jgi:hypothetical protein
MNFKNIFIATVLTSQTETVFSHEAPPGVSETSDKVFRKHDFTHAERVNRHGATTIRINLTQSGLDKLEEKGTFTLPTKLTIEVKGKFYAFKTRSTVMGDEIEVGPFSHREAIKIAKELIS